MGEAKRRKQNDPSYGKVPFLGTESDRHKYFTKMIDNLYSECELELETLISFNKVSDTEYEKIIAKFDRWVKNRLSKFHERDREIIANSLMVFMYEMLEKYDVNSLLCICFMNILKSYVSQELHEELSKALKDMAVETGSA